MRVVAALGGNAFVRSGEALSVEGEHRFAREALAALAPFLAPRAELLLLLTDVPCAYTDHLGPRQAPIRRVTCARARALLAEGHFAPGSMGPKMEAAVRFVAGGDRRAIVCDPPSLAAALRGEAGTIVVPE